MIRAVVPLAAALLAVGCGSDPAVAEPPSEEPPEGGADPPPAADDAVRRLPRPELRLDAENVRLKVENHRGELALCYQQQLREDPEIEGRMVVAWEVEDGRVVDVEVTENETGSESLAACVTTRISAWRYAAGEQGRVTWPFLFQPIEEEAES